MRTGRHSILSLKFLFVLKLQIAELAKLLGLRPRPQWGSLQRSPIPLAKAGGGVPLPHLSYPPLPFAPPLTLNPSSAPDQYHQCTGNQNPTVVTYLRHAPLPQILYDNTLFDKNGDAFHSRDSSTEGARPD